MNFNFNNPLEFIQKFNQFKEMIIQSGRNPQELLQNELKRRNIESSELSKLLDSAKTLQKLIGLK